MIRYLSGLFLLLFITISCRQGKKTDITGKWAINDVRMDEPSGEFLSVSFNKSDYTDLVYEFRKDDSLIFINREHPALKDAINYVVFKHNQQQYVSFGFTSDSNIYRILRINRDTLELGKETLVLQLVRQP